MRALQRFAKAIILPRRLKPRNAAPYRRSRGQTRPTRSGLALRRLHTGRIAGISRRRLRRYIQANLEARQPSALRRGAGGGSRMTGSVLAVALAMGLFVASHLVLSAQRLRARDWWPAWARTGSAACIPCFRWRSSPG